MHREDQFIPELIVRNGPAALDFYKSVFGAEEVHRMMKPGSEKLMHGELHGRATDVALCLALLSIWAISGRFRRTTLTSHKSCLSAMTLLILP